MKIKVLVVASTLILAACSITGLAYYQCSIENAGIIEENRGWRWIIYKDSTLTYMTSENDTSPTWSSTDSASVINSAIGNSSSGDKILIKTAEYIIKSTITDHSKDRITIRGETGAKLKVSDSTNVNIFDVDRQTDWLFYGLELDGNKANNVFQNNGASQCGIHLSISTYCRVENCYIHDFPHHGVRIYNIGASSRDIIINNRITECGYSMSGSFNEGSCIHIWRSNENNVSGNTLINPRNFGVTMDGSSYCHVVNNTVDHAGYDGIYVTSGGHHNEIIGNTVTNCGHGFAGTQGNWGGISCTWGSYLLIQNNYCNNCSKAGIVVHNDQGGVDQIGHRILGNTVEGCKQYVYSAGEGIRVWGTSTRQKDVIVRGNIVRNNEGAGIDVQNSDNVVIDNNEACYTGSGNYQQDYGIHVKSGNTNLTITNNNLWGNVDQLTFDSVPAVLVIYNNTGYVTESSATFTNILNGSYVILSLPMAGTPQIVTITLTVPGNAWVGAKSSTQIQLYFDVPTASGRVDCKYTPQ